MSGHVLPVEWTLGVGAADWPRDAREWRLDAVDALPARHDCPSLRVCWGHPRPRVWRGPISRKWWAWGISFSRWFPTHDEAIRYATSRARADQLTAIQDGAR